MKAKFEIETQLTTGKGKHTNHFVFARCLDSKISFSVTDNSRLNNIEISNYLSQPRMIDRKGNSRLDVFIFKIRYKKDCDQFEEGQIVELIHDKK